MKVLTPGHRYELSSHAGGAPQVLQFIEKKPVADGTPNMYVVNDGTTNEEVLGMLIDRMNHLQAVMPCVENENAVKHLAMAYECMYRRNLDRSIRGVEGTHVP